MGVAKFLVTLLVLYCESPFGLRVTVLGGCATGWTQSGSSCYSKATTTVSSPNFNDSLLACIDVNGNLPTFNTQSDWTEFVSFANANGLSGVSALGYEKYPASAHFTSLYNGQNLQITNWAPGEPNMTISFMAVQYLSSNSWEATDWSTNPMVPVCQQGLAYNANTTYVPCAALCRCFQAAYGHRFSTDPNHCPFDSTTLMEGCIAYTFSMSVPQLTESVYEMANPNTGQTIMAYNSTGRNAAVSLGFTNTVRAFYVSTKPFGSLTAQWFLIWNSATPTDSLITSGGEYQGLTASGWYDAGSFYMFVNPPSANGTCSLALNCTWNPWQAWSSCSVSCGGGTQIRTRTKNTTESNGGLCDNVYQQTNACATKACPRMICNLTGTAADWFCVNDYPEVQAPTSAVQAGSCFCAVQQLMTQQQAANYCNAINGFLTDIQNVGENNLVGSVLNTVQSSLPTGPSLCGPHGTLFGYTCYTYNPKLKKRWEDAEQYCQTTYHGHLASIHDWSVQNFLYVNLTDKCKECHVYGFWVGGNDYGNPDKWLWSDNTTMDVFPNVTHYNKWPPQPDHPDVQQCMTIVKPDGGWGDWHCRERQPFVCAFHAPLVYPAWIGLERTSTGIHDWKIGANCTTLTATYQNLNATVVNLSNTNYVFQTNMVWQAVPSAFAANSAVCRRDRKICGRNLCPSMTPTCTPTALKTCFTCA